MNSGVLRLIVCLIVRLHPPFATHPDRASTHHSTAAAMNRDKDIAVSSTTMPPCNHGKANEYIRASEVPQGSDMRHQSPPRRSFIEKLGLYNIGVLFFGAVASFLAMAFLSLLWSGSETARNGRPTPAIWFTIAETPNWATRVVTIGSVVIRVATAAQMGVFAALVAAWTLETTGASAENLPLLSIIRTVNNGPQSHIWNVFHSIRVGSKRVYSAMILIAIVDVLALQFTSTLLVTDFGQATVVPRATQQALGYGIISQYTNESESGFGSIQPSYGVNLLQTPPPAYPRFAEFFDPASSHFGSDYVDTGETYRAFLPIGFSDTRGLLRAYEGPATVLDSQVRCTRPSVAISNITYAFAFEAADNSPHELLIVGNVSTDGSVPGLTVKAAWNSGSFMASALAKHYANMTDWRLSYSVVNVGDIEAQGSVMTEGGKSAPWSVLLLNITGDWTDVLGMVNYTTGAPYAGNDVVGPYTWIQEPSGIWTTLKTTDANSTVDFGISATLCYIALDTNDLWIHAKSEQDFSEPQNMTWNLGDRRYDTQVVRAMLGATNERLTPDRRGILTLQQPANWTAATMKQTGEDYIWIINQLALGGFVSPAAQRYYPDADWDLYMPGTAILTPFSQTNSVHRTLSSVFQDIMHTTRNPALAFQALYTTMSQTAYYGMLPLFSLESTATVATSETFSVPVQWTCFGIVMGLLVIHAILVVTAVVLFLLETDHSLLGNAWQAVAQVSSSDTMDTMHHASNMTDLEVKRLLRMNSYEDNEVVLRTGSDSGRSQAVYRRGTGDNR